jgi:hypothetical protein
MTSGLLMTSGLKEFPTPQTLVADEFITPIEIVSSVALSESRFQYLIDQTLQVLDTIQKHSELPAQTQAEMTLQALAWLDKIAA